MTKAYVQGYAKDQLEGFKNRLENVAVIGAGGRIGKPIAEALLKTGKHSVTAITRPQSTSQLPEGVNVVRVDYSGTDDSARKELVDVLRSQQALIITMSATVQNGNVARLVDAAAEARVPYVIPNWFGQDTAETDVAHISILESAQAALLNQFSKLDVSAYLLLGCNFWYEFSLAGGHDRYGFNIPNRSAVIFDGGNARMATSTWPQCGRAVANLFSLKLVPEDESDKSATLSQFINGGVSVSSFLITQNDMFESLKRVTKTTDAEWTITHESTERRYNAAMELVKKGDHTAFARALYSHYWHEMSIRKRATTQGLHNDVLQLPVEDLDVATAEAVRMADNHEVAFQH